MALVVICGQPCSGKSIAAVTLAETLRESETKQTVRIIDEASFHLDRNQNYANMPAEKNLRGKLRQWNKERSDSGEDSYDDGIFEDLVRRFEKPERRNRWDSPLFELYPSREAIDKSSPVISEAVTYLTKTVDSKTQDVRILQPSIATQTARVSDANSLYELDRATQEIINAIVEQQSFGGAISRVTLGNELPPIEISRPIGLPELRRLRRTFVKLMGQSSLSGPPLPTDADSAKRRFVDYLNREFGGNNA